MVHKIVIRNKVHDGEKMTGHSYRVPKYPIEARGKLADSDFKIIESMLVKSLITFPKTGAILTENQSLDVRGYTWVGDFEVAEMND
jgi:hypothetical protein